MMSNKVKTSRNLQIGQMMAMSIIAISLVHCIGEVGSISDDESITDSDGPVIHRSHEAQGYNDLEEHEEHEEHDDQEPQELRDSVEYTRAKVLSYKLEHGDSVIGSSESVDAELLAEQKRLDVKDVKKSIEFQDSFYDYALALYREDPEQVSAFWVDPVPGQ